jgi:hypothetical protein
MASNKTGFDEDFGEKDNRVTASQLPVLKTSEEKSGAPRVRMGSVWLEIIN